MKKSTTKRGKKGKENISLLELIEKCDEKGFDKINKDFQIELPTRETIEKWVKATENINEWIYKEFVEKYKDYEERSKKFYEVVKEKFKNEDLGNPIEREKILDPFSLYRYIYSETGWREYIKKLNKEDFSIPNDEVRKIPIPGTPSQMKYRYLGREDEKVFEKMKYWWEFFEIIKDLKDHKVLKESKEFKNLYNKMKESKGIAAPYLTQTLFYIKPLIFAPFRSGYDNIFVEDFKDVEKYLELLDKLHSEEFKKITEYPTIWFSKFLYEFLKKENKPKIDEVIKIFKEVSENSLSLEEIEILKKNGQIVFYGPPGTGKTYLAREIAKEIIGEYFEKSPRYKFVVFHPSFEYEQFIRGIRPVIENGNLIFKTFEGHFLTLCWRALFLSYLDLKKEGCENHENINKENIIKHTKCIVDKNKNDKICIMIIDEINRGNLPVLLGELIYGIEKDKRGTPIDIPYDMPESGNEILKDISKDISSEYINEFWSIFKEEPRRIYIPHNLFIIGTMNTSDRSIGTIDAAIRRRFAFKYIGPDESKVEEGYEKIFGEINNLFKEEGEEEIRVGGVGHFYFMKKEGEEEIKNKIEYFLIPLLREYYELGIAGEKNEELKKIIKELKDKIKKDIPSE